MTCQVCGKRWVDILNVYIINWLDGTEESKLIDETSCPTCGHISEIER